STLRLKTFQLFHPIGGVSAKVLPQTIFSLRSAIPSELLAVRVTFHSPLLFNVPEILPVTGTSFNPRGKFFAANFIGRSPVAATVNKKGDPGRIPKTFAPLIFGSGETFGVNIKGSSRGGAMVSGFSPV